MANVDVANEALLLLGQGTIASLSESSNKARVMNTFLAKVRQMVLRDHPWPEAKVLTTVYAYTEPAATLTPGAGYGTVGGTATFTASAAVFASGDVGKRLWAAESGGGRATITVFNSTTSVDVEIDEAWEGSALAAEDWRLYLALPSHTYDHQIAIPADYIRLVTEDDPDLNATPFTRVGAYWYTDEESLDITYLKDLDDDALWSPTLRMAIVAKLAAEASFNITGQHETKKQMESMYQQHLQEARHAAGRDGSQPRVGDEVLVSVRQGWSTMPWEIR